MPVCVICVKEYHRSCHDQDLLSLQEFYGFSDKQIKMDLVNNKLNRGSLFNTKSSQTKNNVQQWESCKSNAPKILTEQNQNQNIPKKKNHKKKNTNTSVNNCKQQRSLDSILDSRIKITLDLIASTFLKAQNEAVMQKHKLNFFRLENIDKFRTDYKINVNTTNKTIEIEASDINKISRFTEMASFLKNGFEKNFQTQRSKLLQFTSDKLESDFTNIIQTALIELTTKPQISLIEIKAQPNSPWRSENGKLSQVIMFLDPLQKVLAEVQISNVYLKNSKNVEFLIMNKDGFNFWSKKLKFNINSTFSTIPCVAKVDLDLSKGGAISEHCQRYKQSISTQNSNAVSRKLLHKINIFFKFSKKQNKIGLYTYDNEELVSDILFKEQSAGSHLNNTLINEINKNNTKQNSHSEQQISYNDYSDESEDIISSCSEDEDPLITNNNNQNVFLKQFSSQQKAKWEQWDGQSQLYLAVVFHHQSVKFVSRFYQFEADKPLQQ